MSSDEHQQKTGKLNHICFPPILDAAVYYDPGNKTCNRLDAVHIEAMLQEDFWHISPTEHPDAYTLQS